MPPLRLRARRHRLPGAVRRTGRPGSRGRPALSFGCPGCAIGAGTRLPGGDDPTYADGGRSASGTGAHLISGIEAEHVLRRGLAYTNFAGASELAVSSAMELVESYDSTRQLLDRVTARAYPLTRLSEKGALALEIALNADIERRLLHMELEDLRGRWKEEERIAAIADRILL